MNDFLHNLRSGKDKRFERGRRPYINPQFRDNDWRNGNEQKKSGYRKGPSYEQSNAVKSLLENIAKTQERLALAEERVAEAVERIAEALNSPEFIRAESSQSVSQNKPAPETTDVGVKDRTEAFVTNLSDRNEIIDTILSLREKGLTYGKIAEHMESQGIPTFSGKGSWCAQTIHRLYQQNSK